MVETVKQDGEVAFSYMKSWDREARIREEGRKEGHAEGRAEERKKAEPERQKMEAEIRRLQAELARCQGGPEKMR